jgi:hypothetical protein
MALYVVIMIGSDVPNVDKLNYMAERLVPATKDIDGEDGQPLMY